MNVRDVLPYTLFMQIKLRIQFYLFYCCWLLVVLLFFDVATAATAAAVPFALIDFGRMRKTNDSCAGTKV